MDSEVIARLKELESKATAGPWGWRSAGEKSNDAVLGTFFKLDDACTPVGGHVETERYDEEKQEYIEVSDIDEVIAYNENMRGFSDFAFIAILRTHAKALIRAAELSEARRKVCEAARKLELRADGDDTAGAQLVLTEDLQALRLAVDALAALEAEGAGG